MAARRGSPEAELTQRYYWQTLTLAEEFSMRPLLLDRRCLCRNPGYSHAYHTVAGDNLGECVFRPALGSQRAHGQHQIPHVSVAVVDADGDGVRQFGAEGLEDGARLSHDTRAVGFALVPLRWHTQNHAWITGTQGTDDHVVHRLGVFDDDQMGGVHLGDTKFCHRLLRVRQQARLERRVDPGPGDDLPAGHVRPGIHLFDQVAYGIGGDDPFLYQDLADGLSHQGI